MTLLRGKSFLSLSLYPHSQIFANDLGRRSACNLKPRIRNCLASRLAFALNDSLAVASRAWQRGQGEGVSFSEPMMLNKSGSVNQAANEWALPLQHVGQGWIEASFIGYIMILGLWLGRRTDPQLKTNVGLHWTRQPQCFTGNQAPFHAFHQFFSYLYRL